MGVHVPEVGFIGVGAMGSAIASRLVDHHHLRVNDLNPAAAAGLVERGATFVNLAVVEGRWSIGPHLSGVKEFHVLSPCLLRRWQSVLG